SGAVRPAARSRLGTATALSPERCGSTRSTHRALAVCRPQWVWEQLLRPQIVRLQPVLVRLLELAAVRPPAAAHGPEPATAVRPPQPLRCHAASAAAHPWLPTALTAGTVARVLQRH